MNTKVLVSLALLVGMGAVLHAVIPGFFFGMKPDMMLTTMFLGIVLFPSKRAIGLLGITTGVISGITTSFPGGLLPNMLDKPIAALVFAALFFVLRKYQRSVVVVASLTIIGTLVSGVVFLLSALFLVGLPGSATFSSLFLAVVLPTAVINSIAIGIIYQINIAIFKHKKPAV